MAHRVASVILLVLLASQFMESSPALAQSKPELVTSVEGIAEYRLANGLRVLLFPDPTKDTVTVNCTIFVGSRHEGYGEAGMAHLLEHMVFKGTPTFEDIPRALKDKGANFNGTTWLDRTNYYETMPASPETLEFGIALEADRMINSYIRAEDLASEMTVVRNEFERSENNPFSVLMRRITSAAFDWHNYGQATIGNRADIERVPVENLREFYKRYYQPDNAMVVIAGSFSPDRALAIVQKHFGKIPKPTRKLNATYTEEPAQDGERSVTVRRVGDFALVGCAYHIVSGPHPDFAANDILATSLAQAPSGRLYKALVETKMASSVLGFVSPTHDPNTMFFGTQVIDGTDPKDVAETMLATLEGMEEAPITEEEVQRAKAKLLNDWEQTFNNSQTVAIGLSNWAGMGDWRLMFLYRDQLEAATKEDVQRLASQFLRQSNRTLGYFLPTKEPSRTHVPPTPDLTSLIGDYKGRKAVAMGEKFDVSPQNIDARSQTTTIGEGIKVTLLPKKTRGATIDLRLTLRFGDAVSLRDKSAQVRLMGGLLKRGTKNRTRQQINDALDEYRAQLGFSSTPGVLTCVIKVKRENLSPVLDILRDILKNASFPDNEVETFKQQYISFYEQQLSDPRTLAELEVMRKLRPHEPSDPRYIATPAENIERIRNVEAEQIRSVFADLITGNHGELTVVGDFEPSEIVEAIDPIVTAFKSTSNYNRLSNPPVPISSEYNEIKTPDKENACYCAGTVLPVRDDSDDYAALVIGNWIFGGGTLASRLGDRVRQQDGLSYGVRSSLISSAHDQRSEWTILAISNPENIPKLREAIREELNRIRQDGITEEELSSAVAGYIERRKVARTNDAQLAAGLEKNAEAGRTMQFTVELEEKFKRLTVDDVNEAIRTHFDPEKLFTTVAGDL